MVQQRWRLPNLIVLAMTAVLVACGGGTALELTELQRAGGKRLAAAAFLAGHPMPPGERLGV